MLVMRRRAGDSILLGETIEIQVLEICGTRVKFGIVAPDSVVIQRKEIKITRDENITAARSVRQQDISSILAKVTPRPAVDATVKGLTMSLDSQSDIFKARRENGEPEPGHDVQNVTQKEVKS